MIIICHRPLSNLINSIRLIDEHDDVVDGVFLTNKVDLCSPDSRRLIVLFDPGRVKTGLKAHGRMGRALENGLHYRLKINSSFVSKSSCNVANTHSKEFDVIGPDNQSPAPDSWQISIPKANSIDWLSISMNGAHDHVSLAYRIRVKDISGNVVPGYINIGPDDSEWFSNRVNLGVPHVTVSSLIQHWRTLQATD